MGPQGKNSVSIIITWVFILFVKTIVKNIEVLLVKLKEINPLKSLKN